MKFLRNLLAAILGCLIAFGIFFFVFMVFAALVGSSGDKVTVKENTILKVSLTGSIYDHFGADDSDPFAALFEEGQGLDELLHAIKVAKTDDRIKGISIKNNFLLAGLAQTQELRKALADFKASGKKIFALADFYAQKDYYLASVADKVFINPQGLLDFKGLASEVLYFKELQEKTGLKMEVIRHGKYKSAVEPFLADSMSDENRTQIKALLSSIWGELLVDIAASRNLTVAELNAIADSLGARTPQMAIEAGLLDGMRYQDEYDEEWDKAFGEEDAPELNVINIEEYAAAVKNKNKPAGKDKVAVVYAQGEILYGEGNRNTIGQGTFMETLRKVRDNDNIKAVVLRVDSPGGSSLVSDIIWREIELTKAQKPVVASFGNVAASGGYYIAAGADKIFAEPTTVTGSIGVFGTIPNAYELSKEVGINAEQVVTNTNALDYSLFEPMTASFRQQMQESIAQVYDTFLQRVADGRQMTTDQVHQVAQGRVWSGADALNIGLVDELGNLNDAIAAAAALADINDYGIRQYPKYKSEFERLMEDFGGAKLRLGQSLLKEEIGEEAYSALKQLQGMSQRKGVQARLPFSLNIR